MINKKIKIAIWVLSGILILELSMRLFLAKKLDTEIYPLIYEPDSTYGFRYIPNSYGEIKQPGIPYKEFRINNHGFNGPDFNTLPGKDTFRIVVAGSSIANGLWMNGKKNYSMLIQEMLSSRGLKIEVLNCAIDGKGRGKYNLDLIFNELIHYKPNLLLLELEFPLSEQYFSREIYKDRVVGYEADNPEARVYIKNLVDESAITAKYLQKLYDYSYIVRGMCHGYISIYSQDRRSSIMGWGTSRGIIGPFSNKFCTYTEHESISLLKEAKQILSENGSKLLLLSYSNDKTRMKFLQDNGLQSIFMDTTFDESCLSLPNHHFNQKGHDIIAQQIIKHLTTNGFLESAKIENNN